MSRQRRWLPDEVAILDSLVGKYASNKVIYLFRRRARMKLKDDYIERSEMSIRQKATAIGGGIKPILNEINFNVLSEILGIDKNTVYRWKKEGYIKFKRNGYHSVIESKDLIQFAREKPHLLAASPEVNLLQIFDEELVKWIKSHQANDTKPIVVISADGKRYPSVREAAKRNGINPATILHDIRNNNGNWFTEDGYKKAKQSFYGIVCYTIYRLDKKTGDITRHDTNRPPNSNQRRVKLLNLNNKVFMMNSKKYQFSYEVDKLKGISQ